ncbi:ABC transporter ATP-binding protein [Paracoccus sp. MC1854]|uniref:ATP-binding cassette domain-containing protein n=1 Tax=Paracoccus sp. MC1854 TaxID=2760306 RepID=UPI0021052F0A|nr:ABC transporter ATP-binding protein [Paracoccus sp. MC1854]
MSGLRIEELTVSYGRRRVLEGPDLPPLMPGEIVVLTGPDAAGKSSLLKGIAGFLPVRGRVMFGAATFRRCPLWTGRRPWASCRKRCPRGRRCRSWKP